MCCRRLLRLCLLDQCRLVLRLHSRLVLLRRCFDASTYVSLGVPLTSAPPIVDTKAVPLVSVVTTVDASPPTSQVPAVVSSGQTSGTVGPVASPPTPLVVIKQPESVRPYTGTTSYKAYKEYFERICL